MSKNFKIIYLGKSFFSIMIGYIINCDLDSKFSTQNLSLIKIISNNTI